jgi:hypothetical protein
LGVIAVPTHEDVHIGSFYVELCYGTPK